MIALGSTTRMSGQGGPNLRTDEYSALRRIVARHTGLRLSPGKAQEVSRKIAPCWPPSHSGAELVDDLERSPERLQQVVERLTVGESYFYRNRPHFEALRSRVIPALVRDARARRSLSFWSAGCATGEEPYSLATLLHQHFGVLHRWSVTIRGSDLNRRFLARAREAVYPSWSLRGLEPWLVERYFTRLDDDSFALRPVIRSRVTMTEHNLMAETPLDNAPAAGFDLILCRNVLIYFDRPDSDRVIQRLIAALRPGGFLFVGHADSFEALGALEAIYECGTFYYRKPKAPAPRTVTATQLRPGLAVEAVVGSPRARVLPAVPARHTAGPPPPPEAVPPPDPAAELKRARELANTGRVSDALASLQRLATGPGRLDHRVHLLRALVAEQAGLHAEPCRSLRQALFLKRDFVVAHYFLGVLTERSRDWTTAERCFRNTLRLLAPRPPDEALPETGGLTVKRLLEIVEKRLADIRMERESR